MKKSLFRSLIIALVCLFVVTLVGCAKTASDEIFRFEVSTLNLTVDKEMSIGLIPGAIKGEEKVEYVVEIQKEVEENGKMITKWVDASEYLEIVGSEKSEEGKPVSKVSENVVFKAKKEGVIRVTATVISDKTINNFITVTVEKQRLSNVVLEVEKAVITVGESAQAVLKSSLENVSGDAIWSTTDENVLVIDENGKYTAVNKGTCQIVAVSKYDEKMVARYEISVESIIYTITYLNSDGKVLTTEQVESGVGVELTSKKVTVTTGYEFKYWVNGEEKFEKGAILTGDITVTPVIAPKDYKVTLKIGSQNAYTFTCTYGEIVEMPEGYVEPVEEGKVFVGWFNSGDVTKDQLVFGEAFNTTKTSFKAVFADAPTE